MTLSLLIIGIRAGVFKAAGSGTDLCTAVNRALILSEGLSLA